MRSAIMAGLAGALFAVGLALSGMTDPARVHAFLDLSGRWDPRLAFVMIGAIGVHAPTRRMIKTALAAPRQDIDGALVGGAALFGVGWGVSGWCPGPAIVAAGAGRGEALLFVVAMAAGMALAQGIRRLSASRAQGA